MLVYNIEVYLFAYTVFHLCGSVNMNFLNMNIHCRNMNTLKQKLDGPSRSTDLERFFVIRYIFKPSFENSCFFYLILIGDVPNEAFLSLFVTQIL